MNFILLLYISCWIKYGTSRKIYKTKSQLRILDGTNAKDGDYPYIVRSEVRCYNNATKMAFSHHICTSTVLTEFWTLTAAHCIIAVQDGKSLWQMLCPAGFEFKEVISYGKVTSSLFDTNTYSEVISSITHPGYRNVWLSNKPGHQDTHNDIGLLHTHPIILKQYGILSSVDYTTLIGEEALAVGYGFTQVGDMYGDTLQLKLPLQILNILIKRCHGLLKIYPGLCMARQCGKPGAGCPGDSGGPVLHSSGVVGVNSLAIKKDCYPTRKFETGSVAFATATSPYVEWITNHIKRRNNHSNMGR